MMTTHKRTVAAPQCWNSEPPKPTNTLHTATVLLLRRREVRKVLPSVLDGLDVGGGGIFAPPQLLMRKRNAAVNDATAAAVVAEIGFFAETVPLASQQKRTAEGRKGGREAKSLGESNFWPRQTAL